VLIVVAIVAIAVPLASAGLLYRSAKQSST
jgi:hypothetical protein